MFVRRCLALALVAAALAGCKTVARSPDAIPAEAARAERTLTLIVAELQMHLRDDTYRAPRHRAGSGDVFALALWRLDRLQRERAVPEAQWGNVDIVIEYARARALERSRRYAAAARAYERVSRHGSLVHETASEAAHVMQRFARHSVPPGSAPRDELAWLDLRVEKWRELAWEYRQSSYESLALEEAEAWEMARVEAAFQRRGLQTAIDLCHRLIERHRASKLYARHLIRLGDLYADAARREYVRYRTSPDRFDASRYDVYLDRALSSYELAGEQRPAPVRAEAAKKIEALLAAHDGVRTHVR